MSDELGPKKECLSSVTNNFSKHGGYVGNCIEITPEITEFIQRKYDNKNIEK